MKPPASRANTLAWILSGLVVAAGLVMWLVTDRPLFLVFTGLGVITVLNVVVYDRMVLRRKGNDAKPAEPGEPAEPSDQSDSGERS